MIGQALPKVAAIGAIGAALAGKAFLAAGAAGGQPSVISALIQDVGLPVAMLVVLALYHARVVREKSAATRKLAASKDAEIRRLNEERVKAANEHSAKMAELIFATNELARETNGTLDSLVPKEKP